MHCLEDGDWEDEDCCPKCKIEGCISPWQVSKCPNCNRKYYEKMDELMKRIGMRNTDKEIRELKSLLREIQEKFYSSLKDSEFIEWLASKLVNKSFE